MQDLLFTSILVGLTFLIAGVVKGIIGMGLPTVAMGMLGLVMSPVQAAAFLVFPSLITNLWQAFAGPRFFGLLKRFSVMMLGIVVGTFIGINLLLGVTGPMASVVLGVVLVIYGAIGLASIRFNVAPRAEVWLSPLVGGITGVVTGATGVFVVPAVPYLSSLDMGKEELIQALGLSFTVSTIALGLALAVHGKFASMVASGSMLALVPALTGMYLGQRIRKRLSPERFRRWFFASLLLLGGYMAIRGLLA